MTEYESVEVQAYAGYRGEESPRAFRLAGRRTEVVKVLRQWTEEEADSGKMLRCFKVRGSDWRLHVLCFDEGKMKWVYRK